MFSVDVTFIFFALFSLIAAGVFFALSRKLEKLRRFVAPFALVVPVCCFIVYDNFLDKVYILGEANESYEYNVLLLPTSFTFDNNETINITPRYGKYVVIVNNSSNDAVFEAVVYGDATPQPDIQIAVGKVVFIDHSLSYLFSTPPDLINMTKSGMTVGYIHYKVDNAK